MCRLIADCDVFNCATARLTLTFRATASKEISVLVNGMPKRWFFNAGSRSVVVAQRRCGQETAPGQPSADC